MSDCVSVVVHSVSLLFGLVVSNCQLRDWLERLLSGPLLRVKEIISTKTRLKNTFASVMSVLCWE